MYKYLFILVFMCSSFGFSQLKLQDTTAITQSTIKKDAILVQSDSISKIIKGQEVLQDTLAKVNEEIVKHDSLITPEEKFLKLKKLLKDVPDNHYAKNIDQQFLKELYNNELYDTINHLRSQVSDSAVYYPELSKDTLISRLAHLNHRTPFHIEYNPILHSVIKNFLKNRKSSLQRLMGLSHYYFPLFEQELDAYNMPLEMKYLAIVESALNPRAKSRVGATGLWQFMYPTGKEMGLDVSSYVDERSDLLKSTKAACEYLTKCYRIFGDWDLALASYNSGPGNVSKAIRRSGGNQNYWNIRSFLPRETAGYVPIFQATMYVFEYAKEHNFKPDPVQYQFFETEIITVKKKIALEHVSELFDIKMEDLQFLNPSYKLDIIPVVKGEDYTLRLPVQYIGKFVTHEDEIYAYSEREFNKREKPLPSLVKSSNRIRYKVRSGDFLGKVARKFSVKVSQIKRWNGLKSNNLKVGQRLIIYPRHPVKVKKTKKTATNSIKKSSSSTKKTANKHVVKSGESLYSIAKKYSGVSAQNIKDHNNMNNNNLKPGMVLNIPGN